MARYPFAGGPCDGQLSLNWTVKPPVGFHFDCGTHTYEFGADNVFHDAGLAAVFGPETPIDSVQVGRAWHKLMNALAVDGPGSINRIRAVRKRLLRVVR